MGTLAGVVLLAGAPALMRRGYLRLRFPEALWFSATIFGVGAAGGAAGHFLFVHVVEGPLPRRALLVGGVVGLGTAVGAWTVTYAGRTWLSPFEPADGSDGVLARCLGLTVAAGPAVGIALCRMVAAELARRMCPGGVDQPRESGCE